MRHMRTMIQPCLVILCFSSSLGYAMTLASPPAPTKAAVLDNRASIPTRMSICGYETGNPSKGWQAPAGFDCRVDTSHGIWGFCPTTVIAATDCGLGGYCFDNNHCTDGCGSLSDNPSITTWTCTQSDPNSRFCSFAYLTFGVDQTYEYFHCGPNAGTVHYFALPTAEASPTNTAPASSSSLSTQSSPSSSSSPLPSPSTSPPSAIATSTSSIAPATHEPTTASQSTAASQPTTASDSTAGSKSTTPAVPIGAIIGGVIGGIALVCVCVVAVVYIKRDRARKMPPPPPAYKVDDFQQPWAKSPGIKAGGWGPSELPHFQGRRESPVELPS